MSVKTVHHLMFGTDQDADDDPIVQDVAALHDEKLGGSSPKRESRVGITNQQKMEAVAHFKQNKGMTQAALLYWCFINLKFKRDRAKQQ